MTTTTQRGSSGADYPFGGYEQSGIGRQNGFEGFQQCSATKALAAFGEW